MGFPAQSYSILFSALLSASGDGVQSGYAVTKSADGKSYVVATTAALAVSATGTYDGIALQDGNAGRVIQIQRDAKVDKAAMPWMTAGGVEPAVVDANGKVQRASVASGTTYGVVDKEGNVAIGTSGGSLPAFSIAGDVNESPLANKVYSISGNAGAVSILGGAWTIAATVALALTQPQATGDVAAKNIAFHTQPASATSTGTNVTGGSFVVDLGASNKTLSSGDDPYAPAVAIFYSGTPIASWRASRFFGATGVGCGIELNWNDNSWIAIGASSAQTLGVIAVNNNVDAIAARNFGDTDDTALIGTDTSDYVVLARHGAAGVKVVPLAGSGTRVVTADASGVLGTTAIQTAPTGSGVWHSTSGTLDAAASIGTANQVFVTNGAGTDTTWSTTGGDVTGAITALVVGKLQGSIVLSGTPSAGQVLTATSSTAAHWATPSSGGTPGGSNTQMQYNDSGDFGGTAEFTYASSVLNCSATGAISFGTTPATTAFLRFPTTATMVAWWGGAANVVALAADASNNLYLGGTSAGGSEATNAYVQAGSSVNLRVGSTTYLSVTSTTTTFSGSAWAFGAGVVTHGSSVAAAGDYRTKNGWKLNALNGTSAADITLLHVDSSNFVSLGGTTAGATQATVTYLQAASNVLCNIGASTVFSAQAGQVSVQPACNFSVGLQLPTMNSATNTIFLADGTQPTGAPVTGAVYMSSDGGRLHFRSQFSSAGVPVNIRFEEVAGGFGVIDPDHAIKITIDKPGSAAQTRYLRMYQ